MIGRAGTRQDPNQHHHSPLLHFHSPPEKMTNTSTYDPDNVKTEFENLTMAGFIQSATGDSDLTLLMNAIQLSCKSITRAVRKAGTSAGPGLCLNVQGAGEFQGQMMTRSAPLLNVCACLRYCGSLRPGWNGQLFRRPG